MGLMYQAIGQDPLLWLEQAQFLRFSARVILSELKGIWHESQVENEIRQKKLGFVQSYMMLSAMAIENLIKGVIIKGNPNIVRQDDVDNILKKGGHGIVEGARNIPNFTISGASAMFTAVSTRVAWHRVGRLPCPGWMPGTAPFLVDAPLSTWPRLV